MIIGKDCMPEHELIIFRVIQELMNNILKHSNASFIHLTQNTERWQMFSYACTTMDAGLHRLISKN